MESKRLILAIALSIVVIMAYQYFFVKPVKPAQPAQAPASQPVQAAGGGAPAGSEAPPSERAIDDFSALAGREEKPAAPAETPLAPVDEDLKAAADRELVVETDFYRAVFINRGAGLKSFVLKKYRDDRKKPLDLVPESIGRDPVRLYPFYFSTSGQEEAFKLLNRELFASEAPSRMTLQPGRSTVVRFEYRDRQRDLVAWKAFTLTAGSYVIGLDIGVTKKGRPLTEVPVLFGPGLENHASKERNVAASTRIAAWDGQDLRGPVFGSLKTQPTRDAAIADARGDVGSGFHWAAFETTYFAALFRTDTGRSRIAYHLLKVKGSGGESAFAYLVVTRPQAVYLGPKDEEELATIGDRFSEAHRLIEYGWFGSLAKLMLKGLNLIHRVVPNYGWAIIILTLVLKIILFPLTYSSSVSMAKMQDLQPKLKAIRKKYKNMKDMEQRRQMNVEVMALYKQEKVNPAGGCLPLLLQLPILWGFFNMLRVSINIRHAPWIDFWISDLSVKDPIYLLPILMGASQLIVQKMTPSAGDEMQKKLMYMMPVLMVVIFLNFASGLNLYWAFSNILQIGQQQIINRRIHQKRKQEEHERKIWKRKKGASQT